MKDYYQIFGAKRDSTQEEIDNIFENYKKSNQLTIEMYNIYHILNNTTKRKKYNELYDKIKSLTTFKIPFFGYDFDEKYISTFEQKRYLIDNNKYLIYDKEIKNGITTKNYYIESNGKLDILSENTIKKLKAEYYEQKMQDNKTSENRSPRSPTLKDTLLNKVLQK